MERLLKYIRETSEKRTEIELEYAAMKTILETKLRHQFLKRNDQHQYSQNNELEESTENLKVKLRELEKRRTQQALNYEEALLELESLKKNNHRHNIDLFRRNDTKDDLGWLLELMSNYSKEKNINNSSISSTMEGLANNADLDKADLRESAILGSFDGPSKSNNEDPRYYGSSNSEEAYKQSVTLSMTSKLDKQKKHIPAPVQITVENHPNHLNSKIIRWKSPEFNESEEKYLISSYHFYVDGDFYKAIPVNEPLQIILPNLDYETHRVSVRSVCAQGQSKDPQCTIEINPKKFAPTILKANKINGTSANVSWMPSNSNLPHVIWVNDVKFCTCPPGVYKLFLHGLEANSLQKVRVHPILDKYQDESSSSTYLDFHTIPIFNETRTKISNVSKDTLIEEIESPRDIKLKLGSRPGKFIIRWMCSSQPPLSMIKLIGYSILLNNQCLALVNGAKNDRFSLHLHDLRGISKPTNKSFLKMNEPPYLPLTVRTLGSIVETDGITDCTIQSKDSEPPLKFSGQVAAKIAGTAGEAAIMLGDDLAFFLNLITQPCNGDLTYAKSSWHSCYCLNNNNLQEEDSSFLPRSNFDWIENKAATYKSLSIHHLDHTHLENSSRSISNDSTLDKISDNIKKPSNEIFDDSCSSNSSNSLQENSQNVPYKSNNLRRKDLFDSTNGDIELSSNYLAVKNTAKNSQSINNSSKDRSQAKISVPKIQITKDSSFSEDDERCCKNKIKGRRSIDLYDDKTAYSVPPSQYLDYSSLPSQTNESSFSVKQNKECRGNSRVQIHQKSINQNNNSVKNPSEERYYRDNQLVNEEIRYFLALYAYDPDTMSPNPNAINDELSFQTGQKIKIFGQVDEDGFYTGEINGRLGLIPSNMVKEIDNLNTKGKFKKTENSKDQYIDQPQKRPNEPISSRTVQSRTNNDQINSDNHHNYPQNQYGQTMYNQHPMTHRKSNDSEVSYPISDPTSFQKQIEPNHNQRQLSTGSVGPLLKGKRMMALYDYDPQVLSPNVDSDAELAFKANDIITILSEIDEDGFYIGERKGQHGLVPSNFLVEAIPLPNRLKNQQSFDGIQNQFKERNLSAGSNLSDPPLIRDHRYRNRQTSEEMDMTRNSHNTNYEDNSHASHAIHKSESKRIARHASLGHPNTINNGSRNSFPEHQQQRPPPMDNTMSQRISKPINDRRINPSKNNSPYTSAVKSHSRRHSPHTPLEPDDMPIIMVMAPSKENQKKKKMVSVPDVYQPNLPETQETYGQDDNFYDNSNLPISDNMENKQLVFKNSLKKKKP